MGAGAGGVKDTTPFTKISRPGYHHILCSVAQDAVGTDDRVALRVEARASSFHDWEYVVPLLTPTEARRLAAALVTLADAIEQKLP